MAWVEEEGEGHIALKVVCCVSMGLLFSFLDINSKTGTHSGLRVIVGLAACLALFEMSATQD